MEQKQSSNLSQVLNFVADKTLALAKENAVVGAPIERDGITVIPISKLSVGFAGGGSDMLDANRKKRQHPAGGGAKVTLTPMTFLVIAGGEVQQIRVEAPAASPAAEVVDTVIEQVKGFFEERKAKKNEGK